MAGLLASWTVLLVKCAGESLKGAGRAPPGTPSPFADGRFYGMIIPLAISVSIDVYIDIDIDMG